MLFIIKLISFPLFHGKILLTIRRSINNPPVNQSAMINQDKPKNNQEILRAFQKGKLEKARFLIRLELENNPHSVSTWTWAYRLAETAPEKRYCLDKILAVDPENEFAQQKMAELASRQGRDSTSSPGQSHPPHQPQKKFNLIDLIFLPLEWLFQISLPAAIILFFASISFAGYAYYRFNTSFFGLFRPNISSLAFSPNREIIEANDLSWQIQYEKKSPTSFTGRVRHVSPIRIDQFRILTHDLLITTGEFADPDVVTTNVINQTFIWNAPDTRNPEGTINLLHIIPENQEVLSQLYEIKKWQQVQITGQEIFEVKAYDQEGKFLNTWQDLGCNSILVQSVEILED